MIGFAIGCLVCLLAGYWIGRDIGWQGGYFEGLKAAQWREGETI
jgi:hypothetical protein